MIRHFPALRLEGTIRKQILCSFFVLVPLFLESLPFEMRSIKEHIESQLRRAKIETYPFPYLVVHDVLPPALYEYLTSVWPDSTSFDRNSLVRQRLPVTQGCLDLRFLPSDQKGAWECFGEVIVNQYIKNTVKELFLPFLDIKFSFIPEKLDYIRSHILFVDPKSDGLNLDRYGYFIGPHVDQSHIFAAILLYFAEDTEHTDYGTVLYESLVNKRCLDTNFPPRGEFKEVRRIPYLPNTLLVFLQNPSGWHGVETLTERAYLRKAYHATISLKPEFVEEIYGPNIYRAKDLYDGDERYLNPKNFWNY